MDCHRYTVTCDDGAIPRAIEVNRSYLLAISFGARDARPGFAEAPAWLQNK